MYIIIILLLYYLLWFTTKYWQWSQSTYLCQLIFNKTWYDLYLVKLGESMLMLIKQLNWKSEQYWCKSNMFVGKQDIQYYCEIITCIVITVINIKSSRNISCDLWSPEWSSTTIKYSNFFVVENIHWPWYCSEHDYGVIC